jgi:hypothetical protein
MCKVEFVLCMYLFQSTSTERLEGVVNGIQVVVVDSWSLLILFRRSRSMGSFVFGCG